MSRIKPIYVLILIEQLKYINKLNWFMENANSGSGYAMSVDFLFVSNQNKKEPNVMRECKRTKSQFQKKISKSFPNDDKSWFDIVISCLIINYLELKDIRL